MVCSFGGILIIEDDPGLSELLELMLTFEGYRVATAHNGADALPLLLTWKPDLILTDLTMPVMDGLQFLELYQQHTEHAPVVALSAMTTLRRQALAGGAVAFVPKPFDVDELLALVEQYAA